MNDALRTLGKQCHEMLAANPGPGGRASIAAHLSNLLTEPGMAEVLVPPSAGQRDVLYRDSEFGFCILAHNYPGAKSSAPHDHGPTWAIYAQARGETEMTDFKVVEPASETAPGKVVATQTYTLRPGDARVYNEGELHAPSRAAATSLLRVEGQDLSDVQRMSYEIA